MSKKEQEFYNGKYIENHQIGNKMLAEKEQDAVDTIETKEIECEDAKFRDNTLHSTDLYRVMFLELLDKAADDLQNGILKNCKGGRDIFHHILNITEKSFYCCDKDNLNFNEFVLHRETSCTDAQKVKVKVACSLKNTKDDYDLTNFTHKILKSRLKGNQETIKKTSEVKSENKKYHRCLVKNCKKKFKSINGLKYHVQHGHICPNEVIKGFICEYKGCKKKYKNSNGLKYHYEHAHENERK